MESKHRHDFVKCKCGKSFLDGGDDYFRATVSTVPLEEGDMGKHEKADTLTEPITLRNGMYECHDIVYDTIRRLQQSLDDMWAITTVGLMSADKKAQEEKIRFASDTLTTLADIFADAYDTRLDEMKANEQRDTEGY